MEETNLLAKRSELKEIITAGIEKTFPAYFFNWIGRGIMKLFSLKKMPHWTVNALLLLTLLYLPGTLITLATGEIFQWKDVHFITLGIGFYAILMTIICHINVSYNFLPGIRDGIVDFVRSEEDLGRLKNWLGVFWSFRKWLTFMLVGGFLIGLISIFIMSSATREGMGLGWTVITFSVMPFFMITFYVIFYVLSFPSELGKYHLEVYELDPSSSEIIQHLSRTLNAYVYIVASGAAIGTALTSLTPFTRGFVYFAILLGWIPTALQFIANQSAIQKIIVNAKMQTLNRLQAQIRALQNNDLGSVPDETISRINKLMDLHDRIKAKPNSILNLSTGLSFLNQMMLPILGWLLGNIDKLFALFNP